MLALIVFSQYLLIKYGFSLIVSLLSYTLHDQCNILLMIMTKFWFSRILNSYWLRSYFLLTELNEVNWTVEGAVYKCKPWESGTFSCGSILFFRIGSSLRKILTAKLRLMKQCLKILPKLENLVISCGKVLLTCGNKNRSVLATLRRSTGWILDVCRQDAK